MCNIKYSIKYVSTGIVFMCGIKCFNKYSFTYLHLHINEYNIKYRLTRIVYVLTSIVYSICYTRMKVNS